MFKRQNNTSNPVKETFVVKKYTGSRDEVEKKFRRVLPHYISEEQEAVNEALGSLDENGWIALYVCTKAEFDNPDNEDEIRKIIQNHRSRASTAVRFNGFPRLAGSKRYAYQTALSLEEDNCYWVLVRRLAPMTGGSQTSQG